MCVWGPMQGVTAGVGTERTEADDCAQENTATDCISSTQRTSSDAIIKAVLVACSASFGLVTDDAGRILLYKLLL